MKCTHCDHIALWWGGRYQPTCTDPICRKKENARRCLANYHKRKEKNLCGHCGNEKTGSAGLCAKCQSKQAAKTPSAYHRKKAAGKCVRNGCHNRAITGMVLCHSCRNAKNKKHRERTFSERVKERSEVDIWLGRLPY